MPNSSNDSSSSPTGGFRHHVGHLFRRYPIHFISFVALGVLAVTLFTSLFLVNRKTGLSLQAATENSSFSFSPASPVVMPPDRTIAVTFNSQTTPVGFARVDVTFDRTRLNLTGEVETTTRLKTVIEKTSMANANATGRITVVMGLSPEDRANPPTGAFELLRLPLTVVTGTPNQSTTLTIDTSTSQIVGTDQTLLIFSAPSLNFSLNPVPTSTPVPTATTAPTATPTPRPSATPTPRPVTGTPPPPTATPRPTATPVPTAVPTPTPSPTPRPTSTPYPTPTLAPTPTPFPTPTSAPGGGSQTTVTQTYQIANSSDDVNEDNGTYFNNSYLWFGTGSSTSGQYTALRFTGVNIPRGATIESAYVEVYSTQGQWISVNFTAAAEAAGDAATFTGSSRPSQRSLTSATLGHQSSVSWNANTWYRYEGFAPLISAVTSRSDWNPGNSLALIFRGTGSAWGRKFVGSYNTSTSQAPRLVVTYSAPAGSVSTPTPVQPSPTFIPAPEPTVVPNPTTPPWYCRGWFRRFCR